MTNTYKIEGMTCQGCRASVEKKLAQVEGVDQVTVDLEKGEAAMVMSQPISITDLERSLPEKYTISKKTRREETSMVADVGTEEESKWQQLKPLFLILLYISVAMVLMNYKDWNAQSAMLDFMGLFYIVFSFFKMLDLKGFPESFRMYDPLAKRVPVYAKVYPFIETALGLMFLMRFQIPFALIATIVILGITTVGVTKTLLDKKSIRCACLGTALKLPMTEATFIENAIMLVMATTLLVNFL
jgi:copper chaperone CopZ